MTASEPLLRAQLDPASQHWLEQLRASGVVRDAAIRRLYMLLLTEARHEMRRRTARLVHPSGRDIEDLAVQAADDALVAVLSKLDQFRGDALFTTWARRFAALEVPGKIRRRLGRCRETPIEPEDWPSEHEDGEDLIRHVEAREAIRAIGEVIEHELTCHQREVLLALTIHETSVKDLAASLGSTPGALYKTLHDARRKLRSQLDSVHVETVDSSR